MKRITVTLPDDLAAAAECEARRRRVSASEVVRCALAEYLELGDANTPRRLGFVAIGRSGRKNVARDAEEILAREWAPHIDRDR